MTFDTILRSTGTFPSCICKEPLQFDKERNLCLQCPMNSNGTYPDCLCANGLFGIKNGLCIECPVNSAGNYFFFSVFNFKFQLNKIHVNYSLLGVYPDCECSHEDYLFSAYINECYIECGSGSTGLHPHCRCDTLETYYDAAEFACKSNIGRSCPLASIGIGPDCLCVQENYIFAESYWACYPGNATFAYPALASCPDGNKWPQCGVEIDRNTLLSLVG